MKMPFVFLLVFVCIVGGCDAQKLSAGSIAIDSVLNNAEKSLGFSGTVLLVQGNDTMVYRGYGYSDVKKKTPTDKHLAYQIASVSKSFTAIGVLKLVEEGKLSLQDPISQYLKNVPEEKRGITIHQLLSHTSGIGQNYAADGESTAEGAVQKIFRQPLKDSVGKRFIYSNDNYTLLAIIMEVATGTTWEGYLKRAVLTPLGMNETFFPNEYGAVAIPSVPTIDGKRPVLQKRDYGMVGPTGIFSTAADLARFQQVLSTNIILSERTKELLVGKYSKIQSPWAGTTTYYGYGLFVTKSEHNPIERIWLRGNEDSWGTSISIWMPGSKTTLVVLSNSVSLSNGEKPQVYISNELLKHLEVR